MSKAPSHEKILDLAMEVRRGHKKLTEIDSKVVGKVQAVLGSPIMLQQHARRRETELNPRPPRFQAPRAPRAKFV